MKRWMLGLVAAVAIGMLGVSGAHAAKPEKKAKKAGGAANVGMIEKIEGTGSALKLTVTTGRGKKAGTTTVSTDDKTSVTLDGQAKTLADLKVGEYVKLNAATGTVSTIDATTTAPAKGEKKDKKKKKAA
jgi:hypothetical protein